MALSLLYLLITLRLQNPKAPKESHQETLPEAENILRYLKEPTLFMLLRKEKAVTHNLG